MGWAYPYPKKPTKNKQTVALTGPQKIQVSMEKRQAASQLPLHQVLAEKRSEPAHPQTGPSHRTCPCLITPSDSDDPLWAGKADFKATQKLLSNHCTYCYTETAVKKFQSTSDFRQAQFAPALFPLTFWAEKWETNDFAWLLYRLQWCNMSDIFNRWMCYTNVGILNSFWIAKLSVKHF